MRALVINTAYLGDVIFSLPLVENLGRAGYTVDLLTKPHLGVVAEGLPGLGRWRVFDKRGDDAGPGALLRLGRQLRGENYALVLGAHPSIRSGLLARLTGAPKRVGWGAVGYTTRVRRGSVFVEDYLALGRAAGIPTVVTRPRIVCRSHGGPVVPSGAVALAPGSAQATKRWPHYRALAANLLKAGVPVVWLGLDRERPLGDLGGGAIDGFGLSLPATASVLETCRVLVGNDSGLGHLARAVGTEAVLLFGPTPASAHAHDPGRHDLYLPDLACRPCSRSGADRCPRAHHRCLIDLERGIVQARIDRVRG